MLSHLRSLLIRSKSSQLFPLRLTVETEPPKLTFGHACYVFERVAPHPNCPPNGVLRRSKCSYTPRTVSLCVAPPRTGVLGIDASRLLSTWSATAQRQAAVKLYGVFACRLKVLDCAPVMSISPDVSWRQWDSRWAIHASRQLSDKVLRYLKRVIVTPAVYWSFVRLKPDFRYLH